MEQETCKVKLRLTDISKEAYGERYLEIEIDKEDFGRVNTDLLLDEKEVDIVLQHYGTRDIKNILIPMGDNKVSFTRYITRLWELGDVGRVYFKTKYKTNFSKHNIYLKFGKGSYGKIVRLAMDQREKLGEILDKYDMVLPSFHEMEKLGKTYKTPKKKNEDENHIELYKENGEAEFLIRLRKPDYKKLRTIAIFREEEVNKTLYEILNGGIENMMENVKDEIMAPNKP